MKAASNHVQPLKRVPHPQQYNVVTYANYSNREILLQGDAEIVF